MLRWAVISIYYRRPVHSIPDIRRPLSSVDGNHSDDSLAPAQQTDLFKTHFKVVNWSSAEDSTSGHVTFYRSVDFEWCRIQLSVNRRLQSWPPSACREFKSQLCLAWPNDEGWMPNEGLPDPTGPSGLNFIPTPHDPLGFAGVKQVQPSRFEDLSGRWVISRHSLFMMSRCSFSAAYCCQKSDWNVIQTLPINMNNIQSIINFVEYNQSNEKRRNIKCTYIWIRLN